MRPPPSIDGSMNTSASAVMSQCAIDCSRYCSFFPLNPSSAGTLCRNLGDSPILKGRLRSGAFICVHLHSSGACERETHPQFALHAGHVVHRSVAAILLSQPGGILAACLDVSGKSLHRFGGADFSGM